MKNGIFQSVLCFSQILIEGGGFGFLGIGRFNPLELECALVNTAATTNNIGTKFIASVFCVKLSNLGHLTRISWSMSFASMFTADRRKVIRIDTDFWILALTHP